MAEFTDQLKPDDLLRIAIEMVARGMNNDGKPLIESIVNAAYARGKESGVREAAQIFNRH